MKSLMAVFVATIGLAGCGDKAPVAAGGEEVRAESGYLAPPTPDALRTSAGVLTLSGSAPPGGRVRLATPQGDALFGDVDARGRWTIALRPAAAPRIFGLSVTVKGRAAQAEGYVVVTPKGEAALLRAGAGARRIDVAPRPGVRAIDFDHGGGVEVSATAPAGSNVVLHLDGRLAAQGLADAAGRYDASLPTPGSSTEIRPGSHRVEVSGEGFSDGVTFVVSPPAPLAQGPARSQLTDAGLRVDWVTPGGGVQSTILVH